MTLAQLEKRIERLEKIVQSAPLKPATVRNAKSWLEHAGAFADDSGYEEIVRLGRKYRQSLRPKSRKPRH